MGWRMKPTTKTYVLETALKELQTDIKTLTQEIENRAVQAMSLLQQQVYGKIVEKAQEQLKSRRPIYLANLGMINESDRIWVVYLKKDAAWIEDGIKPHEMIDNLTSGPKARTAKDGSRYNIIPFKHNKPANLISSAQLQIQNIVKAELKKRGLDKPIKVGDKIVSGKAAVLKRELTGPNFPMSRTGTPILANLIIYQRMITTAQGKQKLQRDIMTFRVASTKQKGSGKWMHPGLEGANLFKQVEKDVDEMWSQMVKDIVKNV